MTSKSTAEQAAPKKRGAPFKPPEQVKSVRLELRITQQERTEWRAKAKKAGLSLNAWVGNQCNGVK